MGPLHTNENLCNNNISACKLNGKITRGPYIVFVLLQSFSEIASVNLNVNVNGELSFNS